MDFDETACQCPELMIIARRVYEEIPPEDRQSIEKVCKRVVFIHDGDAEAEFFPDELEIRVFLARTKDFSPTGQRGILAHEFGHAYVYSAHGYTKADDRAEKLADMKAQEWGFVNHLNARNNESARLRRA